MTEPTERLLITNFLDRLLNWDERSFIDAEELEGFEPEAFVTALSELVRKAAETVEAGPPESGKAQTLVLHLLHQVDLTESILQIFEKAKNNMDADVFDSAWKVVELTLDEGFDSDLRFAPRLLPNGAIVFRNLHRIFAPTDAYGSIAVSRHALLDEFKELRRRIASGSVDVESRQSPEEIMSFIHFSPKGIEWTLSVPEELSAVGNSMVLLGMPALDVASDLPTLGSQVFQQLAEEHPDDETDPVILRIFEDRIEYHGYFRADDKYDTLVEEFSLKFTASEKKSVDQEVDIELDIDHGEMSIFGVSDEKPDGAGALEYSPSLDPDVLRARIRQSLERFFDSGMGFSTRSVGVSMQPLVEEKLANYVNQKLEQLLHLDPEFGTSWDKPAQR